MTLWKSLKNVLTLTSKLTKSEKSQESEYTPTIFRTPAFTAPHTPKSNHKSVCAQSTGVATPQQFGTTRI